MADLEAYIPELHQHPRPDRPAKLAIMDAVITWPGSWHRHLIDVSARSAHASRYKDAWKTPGAAATRGTKDKADRYGSKVQAIVMETLGRMDPASIQGLNHIVQTAAYLGRAGPGSMVKWRVVLERAVLFSVAENTLLAMGHEGGTRLGAVLDASHATRAKQTRRRPVASPQFGRAAPDNTQHQHQHQLPAQHEQGSQQQQEGDHQQQGGEPAATSTPPAMAAIRDYSTQSPTPPQHHAEGIQGQQQEGSEAQADPMAALQIYSTHPPEPGGAGEDSLPPQQQQMQTPSPS